MNDWIESSRESIKQARKFAELGEITLGWYVLRDTEATKRSGNSDLAWSGHKHGVAKGELMWLIGDLERFLYQQPATNYLAMRKRLRMVPDMNSEFAPIAQRIVNAQNSFVANVQNIANCTKADAEKVLAVYRKAKVLKNDFVNGRIDVKHGAFLDVATIRNAIAS